MKLKLYSVPWLAALVLISACSSTPEYKGVYESEQEQAGLEVPPGLDAPQADGELELPEQRDRVRTYSGYSDTVLNKPRERMLNTYEDMRFVREGSLFWLEVEASPGQVWNDVRDFFRKVGFEIEHEYPQLGMMETNWKENRVNVPANWFGSLFGAVYSSELRDKYRIRLEPGRDEQSTRLFISHQGMKEVATDEDAAAPIDPITTQWVPRESDPELEAEMLMRFMAHRGMDEDKAEQQIAASEDQAQRSELTQQAQEPALKIYEPFERAWRHVGLALDRLGVYVQDQNRSAGVYYIRLPEYFELEEGKGWFAGLFGSEAQTPQNMEYLLVVEEQGDISRVTLRSRGDIEPGQLAKVATVVLKRIQQNIL